MDVKYRGLEYFAQLRNAVSKSTANKDTHATLRNGYPMPLCGLGMWKIPKSICADVVVDAIKSGWRHFDNAADYGNEREVGEGIRRAIKDRLVTRGELFITSKLWNTFHQPQHVLPAIQKTLSDLGLNYLDLYLIHFPISLKYVPFETRYPPEWIYDPAATPGFPMKLTPVNVPISDTWKAMETVHKSGLAKAIGVSNFGVSLLRDLLASATVKPFVNQIELHPYLTQNRLVQFCQSENVHVTAYSPLGAGSYVELGGAKPSDSVLEQKIVGQIAKKYKKTTAQVILRWGVQRGTSIIPKTTKPERMTENLQIFDFRLDEADMQAIGALNQGRRFNDPAIYANFPIFD